MVVVKQDLILDKLRDVPLIEISLPTPYGAEFLVKKEKEYFEE